jgi:NADPH2:quinone reductase
MRALLCRELGDIANLEVGEIDRPVMGPNEVRIGVKASGLNFPDILMVEGKYQVKPALPFVPGLEAAGEVLEIGRDVGGHIKVGDRAMVFVRHGGSHAEEVVVQGGIVTKIPDEMDFVTAAAFPVAYGTAHFALDYRGQLKPGETLLVLGAAGGVGLAAIEVGKMLGARVIAAASSADKLEKARQHGADEVVNYREGSLRDQVRALTDDKGVDVVFDPVGGDGFTQSVRCIGWEGRILVIGFASGEIPKVAANMILVKNFSVVGVVFGEHSSRYPDDSRRLLTKMFDGWRAGQIKPQVMKTYPLDQASAALAEISNRRVMGKLVFTI